jgi:hypothetical protein
MSYGNLGKEIHILESQDAIEFLSNSLSQVRSSVDLYFEPEFHPITGQDGLIEKIGYPSRDKLNVRAITELTEKNLQSFDSYKHLEIRHQQEVHGNFAIFDHDNYIFFVPQNNEHLRIINIRNAEFIGLQQNLFSRFWREGSTLRERRKVLSGSLQFSKEISNPYQVIEELKISTNLAREEILLVCSDLTTVYILDSTGILNLLHKAALKGVGVKIIVNVQNNDEKDQVKSMQKERFPNIALQTMHKGSESKVLSIVIDKQDFMAIQINDRTTNEPIDFIKSCTFSNNQLKVDSAISLFESLWTRASFQNQNIIKQAYFQMFKGFKIKDEVYRRDWSFDKNKDGQK